MKKIWQATIGMAVLVIISTLGFSQETEAAYAQISDMNNQPLVAQVISESRPIRPTRFEQPSPNGLYTYSREVTVKVNLTGLSCPPSTIKYYKNESLLYSAPFYGALGLKTIVTEYGVKYGIYQTEFAYAMSPYFI